MIGFQSIGTAAAFALIGLGAVAFALFGTRYPPNEVGLESYLMALQQKQLELFTKRRVYAVQLNELTAIGLPGIPAGFEVTRLESAGQSFCWTGRVLGNPVRFVVTSQSVKRSSGPVASCD